MTSSPNRVWGHIDAFCEADGWDRIRQDTGHYFWVRTLPDGTLVQTHRSMDANERIGLDVFAQILRRQLRVSKDEFWNAINTGQPVQRPTDLDEAPPEYEGWVVAHLLGFGYTEDEIRQLTPDEAKALVHDKWSAPPGG